MMGLQDELGLPNPLEDCPQEAMLGIVLTGALLIKEGNRLLRPVGLTNAQLNILMLLKYESNDGSVNQTDLGRMLLVNRSNITGLVDRMEKAGWVKRTDDPKDRRVKHVCLTRPGTIALERAEQIYRARLDDVMSALADEECMQMSRMLERVRQRLR